MKIFVVMATHGEYSDRSEVVIKAFVEEAKAQDHVLKAEQRHREIDSLISNKSRIARATGEEAWVAFCVWRNDRTNSEVKSEFDPEYSVQDHNDYYIQETELVMALSVCPS